MGGWRWLTVCVVVGGCAPRGGDVAVEVMRFDGEAGYELRTETLHHVVDLTRGEGERYHVRGGAVFTYEPLWPLTPDDDMPAWGPLTDEARLSTGAPTDLRLDYDPYTAQYRARDDMSLQLLTLMFHLENIQETFQAWGATGVPAETPALVSWEPVLTLRAALPIDLFDFAYSQISYQPLGDAITLAGRDPEAVPVSYGGGVLAHELSHRYMFHNVVVNGAWDAWLRVLVEMEWDRNDPFTLLDATHIAGEDMLRYRAFDEGMANLFGGAYAGQANIYHELYLDEEERQWYWDQDNDLDPSLPFFPFGCGLIEPVRERTFQEVTMTHQPYEVGPPLTRLFWRAADGDPARFRDEVAPAIMAALPDIGARSREMSDEAGHFRFSIAASFNLILERLPPALREGVCMSQGCVPCEFRSSAGEPEPFPRGSFPQ